MTKWVYMFTEGDATMRNTLGGKGANLAEMTKLGLPVPQGFQSLQMLVLSTMKMEERLTMRSWNRSWKQSLKWKRSQERNSVIKRIHFLYLSFRSKSFYARYDGYNLEPWFK